MNSKNYFTHQFSQTVNALINQVEVGFSCEQNYLLSQMINVLPAAIHIKDSQNLKYRMANQHTLNLYGYTNVQQMMGKTVYDMQKAMRKNWPSRYAQKIDHYDRGVILEEKPLIDFEEEPYLSVSGKLRIHSLSKIPLMAPNQEVIGLLTMAFDRSFFENRFQLRKLYQRFYKNKTLAHEHFLAHIGLDKYLPNQNNDDMGLTDRELDCLILLSRGKTMKAIGQQLFISERTVETHLTNIKNKFCYQSRSEMLEEFIELYYAD